MSDCMTVNVYYFSSVIHILYVCDTHICILFVFDVRIGLAQNVRISLCCCADVGCVVQQVLQVNI